jgi:formamidopyrimidine-DNA glycosylase
MPEGPEILYTSLYLKKYLKNCIIEDIISYTDKPAVIPKDDYIGVVEDIGAKGKSFWIKVSGKDKSYYIDIHYGITGWLYPEKPEKNIKFKLIIKNLNNNTYKYLYMDDRRRFSTIKIHTEEQHNKIISKLGIDIFSKEFNLENFRKVIQEKSTILASILMKQEIFCGIGNYIKNEAIHLTNLNIKVKTNQLKPAQIDKLYENILFVSYSNMLELLNYNNLDKLLDNNIKKLIPVNLEIPYNYKIYNREFTIDGQKVFKIKVAGRDSYCIKENC